MKNNKTVLKRTLAIAFSIAFASTVFAQAIRDKSKDFTINGISAKEDIGGVEVTLVDTGRFITKEAPKDTKAFRVAFENYNDFTVTVTYELSIGEWYKECTRYGYNRCIKYDWHPVSKNDRPIKSGTMFLRANESKEIGEDYGDPQDIKIIVRRMGANQQ